MTEPERKLKAKIPVFIQDQGLKRGYDVTLSTSTGQ